MSDTPTDSYISTGIRAEDLKPDQPKRVRTQNGFVVLMRLAGEDVRAFTPICPHANGDLSYGAYYDGAIECPLHGWRFNVRSGECVEPAGGQNLRIYPVRIDDGVVAIEIARPKWMDA